VNLKIINPPTYQAIDVFNLCINSMLESDRKTHLIDIIENFNHSLINYNLKVTQKEWYNIPVFIGGNTDIVFGDVTKASLTKLYDEQFVKNKAPRKIYDHLIANAPLGICPFCGVTEAKSLDHYLPKARYPILSVVPNNLIPSCSDCNKGKTDSFPTNKGQQCLHPYFDHVLLVGEQWLFAEVNETHPPSVLFSVLAPNDWDEDDKARINTHFKDFELAVKFSNQAANELAFLRELLPGDYDADGQGAVKSSLIRSARAYERRSVNSWETAMYQALSQSDWYCDGGFR
jgi:hypothetical protein